MGEWKECRLGEVINLKRGYDLPQKNRISGNVPIISSSGILGYHNVEKIQGPGVITGRYGTIGSVFFSKENFWPLNTALYVDDFKGNDVLFTKYMLTNFDFKKFDDKSAVPGINRNHLHEYEILIPTETRILEFEKLMLPCFKKIKANQTQIRTLEKLRDTLLPKLMSGEVRVRYAAN